MLSLSPFPYDSLLTTLLLRYIARELDEIISHTTFVRSRDPAKYRRFFIVVDELRQEDVDLARKHGIEVATWQTLSDRIKESPFG